MTGTRRFQAEKKLKARGEKKYSLMDWNSACPREDGKYLRSVFQKTKDRDQDTV